MSETIKRSRLRNGVVVLTDRMTNIRSVTLGVFMRSGARDEPESLNGVTHFIEHAVFKGSLSRSQREIAFLTDRLGGGLEAFTMHEETAFAIKAVDNEVETAFDLIADMVTSPAFHESDLKSEQKVIIEEIKMTDDNPEEHLSDLFNARLFGDHPLGAPIAGTPKTVKTFGRKQVLAFHRKLIAPHNLVIVAAGNVEHREIVALAKKYFGKLKASARRVQRQKSPSMLSPLFVKQRRGLEQSHFVLATPFMNADSDSRYAGELLVNILGGGTSSRLWQRIREDRGLAYSVGASGAMYRDCGVFSVYAGTSPECLMEAIEISMAEMRDITRNGIGKEELELAKTQAISSIILGLEDSSNRAASLARLEMVHGRQISVDETISKISKTRPKDILSVARRYFRGDSVAIGAIGDLPKLRLTKKIVSL